MNTAYYRKKPSRWTGETGRALRGDLVTQCVADYLMCPVAGNPFGLYQLDLDAMATAIGVPVPDAERALLTLERLGFALFDTASRYVWVREMAAHQFDLPLAPRNYVTTAARKWYTREPRSNPFLGSWFDRYAEDFRLTEEGTDVTRRDDTVREPPVAEPVRLALASSASGKTMALFRDDDPNEVRMPVKLPERREMVAPGKPHPIREVLAYFDQRFHARFNERPVIDGAKDAKLMKTLLDQQGAERVRAAIDQLFETTDPFIVNTGYTVGVLKSCFNKLMLERSQPSRATQKTSKTAGAVKRFTERE